MSHACVSNFVLSCASNSHATVIQEALARGKAAWAAGDAVTAPQANAALIRAVEELDAAGATHAGALRHDAVAPAFTERLGAGAYGTAYQGALDGVQAVLKEYLVVRWCWF